MSRPITEAPPSRPDLDWFTDANCVAVDWENLTTPLRRKICNNCQVKNNCLEYGLSQSIVAIEHQGIMYGGLTGRQLADQIRKRRKENR